MIGLGSGDNGELTFLDAISILSFIVGLENLDMNITQEDMQRTEDKLSQSLQDQVVEIHKHLEEQDAKLNIILNKLEDL